MLDYLILALAALAIVLTIRNVAMFERARRTHRRVARQAALLRMAPPHVLARFQMHGSAVIKRLREERQACFDFIDKLTSEVEAEGRDMVDAERQNVEAQHKRVQEIDAQLKPLEEFEALREAHRDAGSQYTRTGAGDDGDSGDSGRRLATRTEERQHKYRTVGEFMADTFRASGMAGQNPDTRHLSQRQVESAADRLRSHGLVIQGGALVRASEPHNTTAEVPGLLPEPIVGQVMSDVDAARPFISSIGPRDLGSIPGTTFSRPVVTQHVEVAAQSDEKTELENRQFKVGSVPFTKATYGGWANVSRQSIDWTSPGVWDALMADFIEQYALATENAAADAFATAVTADTDTTAVDVNDITLKELLSGLYEAASKAYQGSGRLPDHIWASLDWWERLGVLVDSLKGSTNGDGGGDSNLSSFAGNLLRVPRTIVPSFASGTLIVGVSSRTEVYEDRLGFISAVSPKVLGVELAYGGYMASGTLKAAAFCKVNFAAGS